MWQNNEKIIKENEELILTPLRPYIEQLDDPQAFLNYFYEIVRDERLNTFGLQIGYGEENVEIAKLIPKDKIVVDVGCGFGFQHILYKDHAGYIGIQQFRENNIKGNYNVRLEVFADNAKIIQGDFKNIGKQLVIGDKDKYFGIANHSLFHDTKRNEEDIELFKELFPLNYYATDLSGKILKLKKNL